MSSSTRVPSRPQRRSRPRRRGAPALQPEQSNRNKSPPPLASMTTADRRRVACAPCAASILATVAPMVVPSTGLPKSVPAGSGPSEVYLSRRTEFNSGAPPERSERAGEARRRGERSKPRERGGGILHLTARLRQRFQLVHREAHRRVRLGRRRCRTPPTVAASHQRYRLRGLCRPGH